MKTHKKLIGSRAARLRGRKRSCGIAVVVATFTFLLAACTSVTPLSHDARTLQAEIRTGQTLQHGDRIRVVTKDGVTRRLSVAFVEGDVLTGYLDTDPPPPVRVDARGNDASERERRSLVHIPISDIVVVEKEELSAGKSAAALGVGYLAFVGIVVIMALISL
jgi:hypothetical protein